MHIKISLGIIGIFGLLVGYIYFGDIFGGAKILISEHLQDGSSYYKNNNGVYYSVRAGRGCSECKIKTIKISGADPGTFQNMNSIYSQDIKNFYVCSWSGPDIFRFTLKCETMHDIDRDSFELIKAESLEFLSIEKYAKDKNFVYFYNKIIPGADPKSFGILNYNCAKDKNKEYCTDGIGRLHLMSLINRSKYLNHEPIPFIDSFVDYGRD